MIVIRPPIIRCILGIYAYTVIEFKTYKFLIFDVSMNNKYCYDTRACDLIDGLDTSRPLEGISRFTHHAPVARRGNHAILQREMCAVSLHEKIFLTILHDLAETSTTLNMFHKIIGKFWKILIDGS